MSFRINFTNRAKKQTESLDRENRVKVDEVIKTIFTNPVPNEMFDVKKIEGLPGAYRIRIGKIRLLYAIDWKNKGIIVFEISFREQAYG